MSPAEWPPEHRYAQGPVTEKELIELWEKAEPGIWVVLAGVDEYDHPTLQVYSCRDQAEAQKLISEARAANIAVACFGGIRCPIYQRLATTGMAITRGTAPTHVSPQVEELVRGYVVEDT